MKIGKVSENVLKRSVYKQIKTKRDEVQFGAGIGMDCAILALSEGETEQITVAMSSDPITLYTEDIGRRAVNLTVNNLAAAGAEPVGVMITALFPGTVNEAQVRTIMQQADQTCSELQIQIMGGHTEITRAVSQPVITATGIGKMDAKRPVCSRQVKPFSDVVVSKWIGMEGTSILAKEKEEELLKRYPAHLIQNAKQFDQMLSVLPEAATAVKSGVSVMHDMTESGIFGALWEIAESVGVGLEIDLKRIPVKQETIEVCEFFDLNPYKLLSTGSLIMITENGHNLVRDLNKQGIVATVIGKTTDNNDKVILNEEERRFLEIPGTDTLRKVLEQ